ncbi:competence/damage-inducible protein A [Paenibacillus sp. y28]|uniref:competence/damage-inducible protein A n=1 Tax=Paenibacillus sp. y28 TaxID=3129110 RepID=UPI003017C524
MRAEIIAVGTELLLGQIVNSNAQFLSQELASLGVDVYFQTVVGDNEARITAALEAARSRAELIICTGGLGPTQDDLTKDVLARFLSQTLVLHQPTLDNIVNQFRSRGITMVESNKRMAYILEQSEALPNDTGQAAGVALTQDGTHYILLPGPPKEMKPMFQSYAAPWIQKVMGDERPLFSKMLKFAGIGESSLEDRLLDLITGQQDPTIAPYAKEGEVALRLSTKASNEAEAQLKMAATETEIRSRVGQHLFAEEDIPLEAALVRQLAQNNATLSVAESCSGGLLGDMVTSVPGCSRVFRGGVICYSNQMKETLLSIPSALLEGEGAPGAVSRECAVMMADRIRQITGTDYAISITGEAGPAAAENKPVGLVYIGLAGPGFETYATEFQFGGGRDAIKLRSARQALYLLWGKTR